MFKREGFYGAEGADEESLWLHIAPTSSLELAVPGALAGTRFQNVAVSFFNKLGNPVREFVFTNPDGSHESVLSPDPGRALITGVAPSLDPAHTAGRSGYRRVYEAAVKTGGRICYRAATQRAGVPGLSGTGDTADAVPVPAS